MSEPGSLTKPYCTRSKYRCRLFDYTSIAAIGQVEKTQCCAICGAQLALSPSPKHGYAILKEAEALSEGRVQLSTGTLYGAIKRLLDDGWIHRMDDPLPNRTQCERKAYVLIEQGQRVLNAEIERLRKLVNVAQIQTVEETLYC
jgi:DNA-binding PadR family transcriptional regulator